MSDIDRAAAFDSARIAETVKDRVRGAIIDAIPADTWKVMIQKEVDVFLRARTEPYGSYGDKKVVPSGLSQVVQEVLREETHRRVTAMLQGPDWQVYWDGQGTAVGNEMQRLVTTCGPQILSELFATAVRSIVQQVPNYFQTTPRY